MSADRFEARVADWLEDGPDVAPAATIQATLAYAAAHPRTRRHAAALRASRFAPALAAAAVVVLVAGSSVAVLSRFPPAVTPVAPVAVAGTETCATPVVGERIMDQEGVWELTGRMDICQDTVSDSRVSGRLTRRVSADLFDPGDGYPDGASNTYGTTVLQAGAGAWTGTFVGSYLGRTGTPPGRLSWIALGSGAYRGLVYRATVVTDSTGRTTVTGTIESIPDDAVLASTRCWVDSATPDISTAGPVPHRDAYRTCTITSDDDRLAGTAKEHRLIDVGAGGTTTDTGTLAVTAAAGGWDGTFRGTGDWYVPGVVTGTLKGTGGLEGLGLSFRIVSEDGMRGVLVGTIAAAP